MLKLSNSRLDSLTLRALYPGMTCTTEIESVHITVTDRYAFKNEVDVIRLLLANVS